MQRALAVAGLSLAFAGCGRSPTPSPAPAPTAGSTASAGSATPTRGHGKVVDARFTSAALGVDKAYRAYLPAGYDDAPPRRYPVIYMLHGLGGYERSWIQGGALDQAADALGLQAIVIMPDGDAGFYVDAVTPQAPGDCAHGSPFNRHETAADYCVERRDYERYGLGPPGGVSIGVPAADDR